MSFKQLFARKTLETLLAEAEGDNRLRRVLGPIALTSLGVGAIIGAGIFVMTGRAAAVDAGPAILLSYCVAGLGCLFAALCYAEFASMAPVAGSAYTYAYATLGELMAWIIGWDLVLEYAMACACVAAGWADYLNEFLRVVVGPKFVVPEFLCSDPFSVRGAWFNLPAVLITVLVTVILVIGIRESATTNAVLVAVKLGVVLFVIVVGLGYINSANWLTVPVEERLLPEETSIPSRAEAFLAEHLKVEEAPKNQVEQLEKQALAAYRLERREQIIDARVKEGKLDADKAAAQRAEAQKRYGPDLATTAEDKALVQEVLVKVRHEAPKYAAKKWGILAYLGIDRWLLPIDNALRTSFSPYGLSGIMLGAAIVFFAYIGFDSISTHSEEARRPQRDVPIAILASLVLCTVLYIGVSAIITGMVPYPNINQKAAVAAAFRELGEKQNRPVLKAAAALIATGALAGLTSVLLITFLSQARIFLAMARDKLLPPVVFGAVHPIFRTPHRSTMLTGALITVVAAFTPISKLEEMVNIGTLMAFVIVCASVLLLRLQRPHAHRPFYCPVIWAVAPLGVLVNLIMMLFLPIDTWVRLVVWLVIGLGIYFSYGMSRSMVGKRLNSMVSKKA